MMQPPAEKNVLHSKLVHLYVHVQAYLPTYLIAHSYLPTHLPTYLSTCWIMHPSWKKNGMHSKLVHLYVHVHAYLPTSSPIYIMCASSENIWQEQFEGTAQVTSLISLCYLAGDQRRNPNDKKDN